MSCDMKKVANRALTPLLEQVRADLDNLRQEIHNALRVLEGSREELVNTIVALVSPQGVDPEKRIHLEGYVEESFDAAVNDIHKARNLIGRLSVVTRNGIDITKRVEKTWIEALKKWVKDTKWYREHYPHLYEKERRRKEYERYRMRPEFFHSRPVGLPEPERGPELEEVRVRGSLNRMAQTSNPLEFVTSEIEEIFTHIMQVIHKYFTADSPLLEASNRVLQGVKNKQLRERERAMWQALEDEVRIIENLFGFERQPGRFITTGSRAFLIPAAKLLQSSLTRLHEIPQQVASTQQFTPEEAEALGLPQSTQAEQPVEAEARLYRVLERRNTNQKRQRRCDILQRIASSRS